MNNTLHTPAPWYIAHHSDIDGEKSIDIRHCCDIPPSTPEIHQIARLPENALANARLIASAPDLMAICEEIANDSKCDLVNSERRIRLYSAIRKAKGEA